MRQILVSDLYESNGILPLPERLHNAIDAIAWESKNNVHAPVDQPVNQQFCRGPSHTLTSEKLFDTQVWYLYRSFRGGQFMYCELQRPKDGKEDHYDNEQYRRHRQSDSNVVAKLVTTWTHNEDIDRMTERCDEGH